MRGRRRMGVRARVEVAFALGGLLVSGFLAAVSWNLTTTYLYSQRELTATRSALVSADLLGRRIRADGEPSVRSLQESVTVGNDAVYLSPDLERGVATSPRVGPADLPRPLVALAVDGVPAQQRIVVDGEPALAIALPLRPGNGVYVEVFPLVELDRTLNVLGGVLAITAALATLLAAALGRWATHRTLRPLQVLVVAASDVAHGDLDTRLDASGDPDLEPLADALNTTAAALRARVERDARFASDVSHELRSPLMTMLNASALLRNRRGELSPPGREALDLLDAEIQRFRDLVQDLLEISRDDQQRDVHLQRLRLADLVRRAADREAGQPVTEVTAGAEDVFVDADARRLERVVVNLVANARLHGGGVRRVTVERVRDAARVTVQDHGEGIAPAERERVFERFFRGRASRAGSPGSGLGLAIVAQHVATHGGRVWVEDGDPVGAAFVVELPTAGACP